MIYCHFYVVTELFSDINLLLLIKLYTFVVEFEL